MQVSTSTDWPRARGSGRRTTRRKVSRASPLGRVRISAGAETRPRSTTSFRSITATLMQRACAPDGGEPRARRRSVDAARRVWTAARAPVRSQCWSSGPAPGPRARPRPAGRSRRGARRPRPRPPRRSSGPGRGRPRAAPRRSRAVPVGMPCSRRALGVSAGVGVQTRRRRPRVVVVQSSSSRSVNSIRAGPRRP